MGSNQSVVCVQAASAGHESPHQQYIPALKQQQHTKEKASVAPVYAADSASSISGSHMESEQEQLKQHPVVGRKLLATVRDSLLRKPWLSLTASVVLSGIPTHTAEQQAAVQAAYDEVLAGAKQRFEDLYQMGHMLGSGHYARCETAVLTQGRTPATQTLQYYLRTDEIMRGSACIISRTGSYQLHNTGGLMPASRPPQTCSARLCMQDTPQGATLIAQLVYAIICYLHAGCMWQSVTKTAPHTQQRSCPRL